jgi:hypothetical protein
MQRKTGSTEVVGGATDHAGILQTTNVTYVCKNVIVTMYVEEKGHHHGCITKERRCNHGFIAKKGYDAFLCTQFVPANVPLKFPS